MSIMQGAPTLPYDESQAPWFGGRDPEKDLIVSLIEANRYILIHGPAGAGKSSLLAGGVFPLLRSRGTAAAILHLRVPNGVSIELKEFPEPPLEIDTEELLSEGDPPDPAFAAVEAVRIIRKFMKVFRSMNFIIDNGESVFGVGWDPDDTEDAIFNEGNRPSVSEPKFQCVPPTRIFIVFDSFENALMSAAAHDDGHMQIQASGGVVESERKSSPPGHSETKLLKHLASGISSLDRHLLVITRKHFPSLGYWYCCSVAYVVRNRFVGQLMKYRDIVPGHANCSFDLDRLPAENAADALLRVLPELAANGDTRETVTEWFLDKAMVDDSCPDVVLQEERLVQPVIVRLMGRWLSESGRLEALKNGGEGRQHVLTELSSDLLRDYIRTSIDDVVRRVPAERQALIERAIRVWLAGYLLSEKNELLAVSYDDIRDVVGAEGNNDDKILILQALNELQRLGVVEMTDSGGLVERKQQGTCRLVHVNLVRPILNDNEKWCRDNEDAGQSKFLIAVADYARTGVVNFDVPSVPGEAREVPDEPFSLGSDSLAIDREFHAAWRANADAKNTSIRLKRAARRSWVVIGLAIMFALLISGYYGASIRKAQSQLADVKDKSEGISEANKVLNGKNVALQLHMDGQNAQIKITEGQMKVALEEKAKIKEEKDNIYEQYSGISKEYESSAGSVPGTLMSIVNHDAAVRFRDLAQQFALDSSKSQSVSDALVRLNHRFLGVVPVYETPRARNHLLPYLAETSHGLVGWKDGENGPSLILNDKIEKITGGEIDGQPKNVRPLGVFWNKSSEVLLSVAADSDVGSLVIRCRLWKWNRETQGFAPHGKTRSWSIEESVEGYRMPIRMPVSIQRFQFQSDGRTASMVTERSLWWIDLENGGAKRLLDRESYYVGEKGLKIASGSATDKCVLREGIADAVVLPVGSAGCSFLALCYVDMAVPKSRSENEVGGRVRIHFVMRGTAGKADPTGVSTLLSLAADSQNAREVIQRICDFGTKSGRPADPVLRSALDEDSIPNVSLLWAPGGGDGVAKGGTIGIMAANEGRIRLYRLEFKDCDFKRVMAIQDEGLAQIPVTAPVCLRSIVTERQINMAVAGSLVGFTTGAGNYEEWRFRRAGSIRVRSISFGNCTFDNSGGSLLVSDETGLNRIYPSLDAFGQPSHYVEAGNVAGPKAAARVGSASDSAGLDSAGLDSGNAGKIDKPDEGGGAQIRELGWPEGFTLASAFNRCIAISEDGNWVAAPGIMKIAGHDGKEETKSEVPVIWCSESPSGVFIAPNNFGTDTSVIAMDVAGLSVGGAKLIWADRGGNILAASAQKDDARPGHLWVGPAELLQEGSFGTKPKKEYWRVVHWVDVAKGEWVAASDRGLFVHCDNSGKMESLEIGKSDGSEETICDIVAVRGEACQAFGVDFLLASVSGRVFWVGRSGETWRYGPLIADSARSIESMGFFPVLQAEKRKTWSLVLGDTDGLVTFHTLSASVPMSEGNVQFSESTGEIPSFSHLKGRSVLRVTGDSDGLYLLSGTNKGEARLWCRSLYQIGLQPDFDLTLPPLGGAEIRGMWCGMLNERKMARILLSVRPDAGSSLQGKLYLTDYVLAKSKR